MSIKKVIELTNEEFFFLASLFECDALIGVPDPFIGYWIEDIETGMKHAAQSLVKKGYIVYKDHDIDVMPELLEYMKICTKTKMTLWVQLEENGKREETYFYLDKHRVIESRVFEKGEHLTYHLQERGMPIQLWNELVKKILPKEKRTVCDGRITLEAEEFADMLENHHYNLSDVEMKLKNAPPQMMKLLAKAIKNHNHYSQLTVFYRMKEDWIINSVSILSDANTNWIAVGTDEKLYPCVEIRSASPKECIHEIQNIIPPNGR